MAARVVLLGSGSSGNATLVELAGRRILVDAGLAAGTLAERLRAVGVEPQHLDGLVLSHEHGDHARGAARFSQRHGVPVFASWETLQAMNLSPVHFAAWEPLGPGGRLAIGGLRVETFPVPHDAAAPLGLVVEGEGVRVGIVTDLGRATSLVEARLRGCEVLVVEANHDDLLLRHGPYPWALKQRVGGRWGHLSNAEAAELLERVLAPSCRAVVLAHLSEQNNRPDLAWRAVEPVRRRRAPRASLHVAVGRGVTPPLQL